VPREETPATTRDPGDPPPLARLLRERLGATSEDAAETRREGWAALAEPELRRRVLARLEGELRSLQPELLVPLDADAQGLTTALADRTELPLGPVGAHGPPVHAESEGRRAAVVGAVLRASTVANVVRSVEEGGDEVVAIVGIAARDGGDLAMLTEHYNIVSLITL